MKDQNVIDKFEDAVSKFSDKVAVKTKELTLSYEALNAKANILSQLIRENVIGASNNVTLLLDHNEEIIVGILAVLKSGKAYVPIDPHFPLERSRKIVNDADSTILLTTNSQLSLAYKLLNSAKNELTIINVSDLKEKTVENPTLSINASSPAYVMYTSGSTGVPKGVAQSHETVVKSIDNYIKELDINATDNILLTTPYSHTVSVIDIFSALFSGGCLTIFNIKKSVDIADFTQQIYDHDVSIIHTVPTFYRYFIKSVHDITKLSKVRLIILGGEEVLDKDVDAYKEVFDDKCLFVNLYGSSEVILGCLNIMDKNAENDRKIVPLGFPFDNIEALILDENLEETPIHGVGELYFGAQFLNPKYYKDLEATDHLFLPKSDEKEFRFVRMGDLVKLLPDGNIQLIGRKDYQIKISGNRVHLNEIELCLDADPTVNQSVVVPLKSETKDTALIAFISTTEEKPDIEGIKEKLRANLPEYMIPAFYVKLDAIPLTPNGKVDRNGLPKISYDELKLNKDVHAKTAIQKTVLEIWKSTLEKEDITIHDNFFHLGGNSLIATEIVNKIFLELEIEVELSAIFDYQSVFEIARFLEGEKLKEVI